MTKILPRILLLYCRASKCKCTSKKKKRKGEKKRGKETINNSGLRYATEDALTVTHRSGISYKRMREVVASLLPYPKGGVPTYVPTGSEFLGRVREESELSEMVLAEDYFVVAQYTTQSEDTVGRATLLNEERLLAKQMEAIEDVLAVWCFVPRSSEDGQVPVTIFIRLVGRDSFRGIIGERMRQFEYEQAVHKKHCVED